MTIESAVYISDLNAANPGATDLKAEGDDHMRLIKSTVKATFPNITGVVTPTHTVINNLAAGTFPTVPITGVTNLTASGTATAGIVTIPAQAAVTLLNVGDATNGRNLGTFGDMTFSIGQQAGANARELMAAGSPTLAVGTVGAGAFGVYINGAYRMSVSATGAVLAGTFNGLLGTANISQFTNDAGYVTGTVTSGTYTPTLTAVANVSASGSTICSWMRVGNVVTVSLYIALTPSASNTLTKLGISLPVASNLASPSDLAGSATRDPNGGGLPLSGALFGDATNHRAQLSISQDSLGASQTYTGTFTYRVI